MKTTRTRNRPIHQSSERKKLPARQEPYWQQIKTGQHIGFCKPPNGGESWKARWTNPTTGERLSTTVGPVSPACSYDQAVEAALVWFEGAASNRAPVRTVEEACEAYLTNLDRDGRKDTARNVRVRFNVVYRHRIAKLKLDEITAEDLREWRDSLLKTNKPASANRYMKALKAALNFAHAEGYVDSSAPWDRVKHLRKAEKRRETYLTLDMRRALLTELRLHERVGESICNLCMAIMYTGARPGDVARAKVKAFNERSHTVIFRTEKGSSGGSDYTFPLENPAAFAFFKRMAAGKLPLAPLISREDGAHMQNQNWERFIRAARRKLKLPEDVVAYSFRHAAITDFLAAGIPVAIVAEQTGTSIGEINDHYMKNIRTTDNAARLASITYL